MSASFIELRNVTLRLQDLEKAIATQRKIAADTAGQQAEVARARLAGLLAELDRTLAPCR